MLRCELTSQLLRLRTLIALACLAAVPVVAAGATASSAGHGRGQGGLFGLSTYSALNHMMASLEFIGPLLLPTLVALLAASAASADRGWGILRYLYAAPVTRGRLLAAQLVTTAAATALAVACVLVAGLAAGVAVFGWHGLHVDGATVLAAGDTTLRVLAACGYVLLCMLAMAALAFLLGVLLPRGAEAVAGAIGFVVVASILSGHDVLHPLVVVLPVHYWQDWTGLFDPGATPDLWLGVFVQTAAIAVCIAATWTVLRTRDPAA